AHDEGIDLAAEIAGDETDQHARDHRQRHDDETDKERETRAVDEAREDVAADGVGAENMPPHAALLEDRRQEKQLAVLAARAVRRDEGRKDRHEQDDHKDEEADDGALVAREIEPEFGKARGRRATRLGVGRVLNRAHGSPPSTGYAG